MFASYALKIDWSRDEHHWSTFADCQRARQNPVLSQVRKSRSLDSVRRAHSARDDSVICGFRWRLSARIGSSVIMRLWRTPPMS